MEEKETKTVTMPLSEYNQMLEEIQNLKTQGIRGEVIEYVGMSIEDAKAFYRLRGISIIDFAEHAQKRSQDLGRINEVLHEKVIQLKEENEEYSNSFKELKDKIKELKMEVDYYESQNLKKKWWQFWNKI